MQCLLFCLTPTIKGKKQHKTFSECMSCASVVLRNKSSYAATKCSQTKVDSKMQRQKQTLGAEMAAYKITKAVSRR